MYHLDDKDVDRISRNAADNYKAPGEPSWDALRQTLDKEMPQEKEKKRRGFFLLFLLAGLSVAGSLFWFNYRKNISPDISALRNNKENGSTIAPTSNTPNITVPVAKANAVTTTGKKITDPKSGKANAVTTDRAGLPALSEKENTDATTHTNSSNKFPRNKSFKNNITGQPLSGRPFLLNNASDISSLRKGNKFKNNKPLTGTDNTDNTSDVTGSNKKPVAADKNLKAEDDTVSDTGSDKNMSTTGTNNITDKTTSAKDTVTSKPVAEPEPEKKESVKAEKKKPASKSKVEKAFNIGVTAGVDYTTVHFRYGDNAGFNIGIMGGYQFSKNWSVYTGAVYTKKNYKLSGKDYNPPASYWTSYVDLQTVDGYCRMWEVPLLARYTFNSKSNTRFFVSTGLSSYFMKMQQYNYNYKVNGTPGSNSWTNNTDYNHLFSILHFSAGIEKQIGKHLNWQVEPYAKLPLHGVGFGDIKLSSFGINFSIQYRQPVKR